MMTRSALCLLSLLIYFFNSHNVMALKSENINGGVIAPEDAYNFFVSLTTSGSDIHCGGAIIDENFIVTAAHCVIDLDTLQFRPEIIYIIRRSNVGEIIGQVEKIYVPRTFQRRVDDIAVLKLSSSLDSNLYPMLSKLSLPGVHENYHGVMAEIPGSGNDKPETCADLMGEIVPCNKKVEYRLKVLQTMIVSNEVCRSPVPVKSYHICGNALEAYALMPSGLCDGDSGSPVVYRDTLIGVVSEGSISCDERFVSATFTRVSSYVPFIQVAVSGVPNSLIRVAQSYPAYGAYIETN